MKQRYLLLLFLGVLLVFGVSYYQTENKILRDAYHRFLGNLTQDFDQGGTSGGELDTGNSNSTSCAMVYKMQPDSYYVELHLISRERCKKEILFGTTLEEYRAIRLEKFKKYLEIVRLFPTECKETIHYLQEKIDHPNKITATFIQDYINRIRYYPVDHLLKETRSYLLNFNSDRYKPISQETLAGSQIGTFSESRRFSELHEAFKLQHDEQILETTCSNAVDRNLSTEFPEESYFWGFPIDSPRKFLYSNCYYGKYYDTPERQKLKCATLSEEF
ncbi:hypothetical protein CH373_04110 [Leptospira perolatii]|uniref:Uncharacterized protein n=1 Tax=Leptospira perolatii TaxID=2023191 RepID=A0A2M9ZPX5_9LEPT|nr:hypothetical protein [Leptospira perolatii]PJZ69015.1 hypothetical protein CH360_13220 [Leptospira perolatii]PJZ74116.1 hypothetical protein CH373_04110 [Leptospira perolatii]